MPDIRADEIITLRHKRNFIQFGGPTPTSPVAYAGQNAQYMAIEGLSVSETGGIDPIFVPDPNRIGMYRLVGRSITPPDLASATLLMREKHGSIPRQLYRIGCQFNLYESVGNCSDLSDFLQGWSDYVLVYSGALVTDKDFGNRSAWDSDDAAEDSLSITLADVYPVGPLSFGEGAASEADREVVDVVYQNTLSCGDCGPSVSPSDRIYAITKSSGAGSPGMPAEVIYSLNGGTTWYQMDITGIGASEDPLGVDIVGNYIVILAGTSAAPAYYYAEINSKTGVPGAFTKITTGFVANHQAVDLYVVSPREVFMVGEGGYIYKSTDIASGVSLVNAGIATTQNLYRISGNGDTIVATGAGGVIIKSINRGATWSTTTTSPTVSDIRAVAVVDKFIYWIGHIAGRIYYTLDGGETWTEKGYSGSGVGSVYDIVFPTREVGYISYTTATPAARILATWNGGADWTTAAPRILNMPTYQRANRLAYPTADSATSVNNLTIAGLSSGGTDGILLVGIASRL